MNVSMKNDAAPIHGIVMRRFAVFGGECYYAKGGFHDYKRSLDTLDEAMDFFIERKLTAKKMDKNNRQIMFNSFLSKVLTIVVKFYGPMVL